MSRILAAVRPAFIDYRWPCAISGLLRFVRDCGPLRGEICLDLLHSCLDLLAGFPERLIGGSLQLSNVPLQRVNRRS
jgi:hypothetical protein